MDFAIKVPPFGHIQNGRKSFGMMVISTQEKEIFQIGGLPSGRLSLHGQCVKYPAAFRGD
jgi:hypothetical protein